MANNEQASQRIYWPYKEAPGDQTPLALHTLLKLGFASQIVEIDGKPAYVFSDSEVDKDLARKLVLGEVTSEIYTINQIWLENSDYVLIVIQHTGSTTSTEHHLAKYFTMHDIRTPMAALITIFYLISRYIDVTNSDGHLTLINEALDRIRPVLESLHRVNMEKEAKIENIQVDLAEIASKATLLVEGEVRTVISSKNALVNSLTYLVERFAKVLDAIILSSAAGLDPKTLEDPTVKVRELRQITARSSENPSSIGSEELIAKVRDILDQATLYKLLNGLDTFTEKSQELINCLLNILDSITTLTEQLKESYNNNDYKEVKENSADKVAPKLVEVETRLGYVHSYLQKFGLLIELVRGKDLSTVPRLELSEHTKKLVGSKEIDLNIDESTAQLNQPELTLILRELIDNAIRAAIPKTTVKAELVENQDGNLFFKVTNTGSPVDIGLARLPFYRPDAERAADKGGLGIGLTIVELLCMRLNASYVIETDEVGVTTVTLQVPSNYATP